MPSHWKKTIIITVLAALGLVWPSSAKADYWGTVSRFANQLNQDSRYTANYIAVLPASRENLQAVAAVFPGLVWKLAQQMGGDAVDLLNIDGWVKMVLKGPKNYFTGTAQRELARVALVAGTFGDQGKLALILAKLKNGNYDVYAVVNKRRYNSGRQRWDRVSGSEVTPIADNLASYRIPAPIRTAVGGGIQAGPAPSAKKGPSALGSKVTRQNKNSLHLDGRDDYVSLPVIRLDRLSGFTVQAWIKPDSVSGKRYYEISRQQGGGPPDYLFSFQENGRVLSFGLNAGGSYNELDVRIKPRDVADGRWHHVAAVYDGRSKKIYLDGRLIGSNPDSGRMKGRAGRHDLGRYPKGREYFDGLIDEYTIYGRALSQSEIKGKMNKPHDRDANGLLVYYDFEYVKGSQLRDQSKQGNNHGALKNGARVGPPNTPF